MRTHEETVEKMESLRGLPKKDIDTIETKGIKGPSPLLDYTTYPPFSIIDNVPAEYMHLMALGVTKRALEQLLRDKESASATFRPMQYAYIKSKYNII